ncbi:hypothetical protein F4818DRAFT_456085 [Hypoxylon cercidicola]|nr:hypothetical protein F4818DRAFT_456085 [Hypoxylon cercidicola]
MRASYSIVAVALLCHKAFAQCVDGLAVLASGLEVSVQCSASVSEDAAAYTKQTTTAAVATETRTVSYDRCSVGYFSGGNGKNNRSENVEAVSSQDCCEKCQLKQNCVASVYTRTTCQHLVKSSQLSGAETSDQCPLGIEDYAFGNAGGMVYPGPCAH